MAPDERARNLMYDRLREVMGHDVADTMMESLSPTGWRDLATKEDLGSKLELLEHKLTAVFRQELIPIHTALDAQTRTYVGWTIGLIVPLAGFFWAVTR